MESEVRHTNPICCICGKECENEYGNNPDPFVKLEGARCCDACDYAYVIPMRIRLAVEARRQAEKKTEKVSVRLSKEELQKLDSICEVTKRGRSNVITWLIEQAHNQLCDKEE